MHDLSKYKYTQFIRTALRQFRRIVKCIETTLFILQRNAAILAFDQNPSAPVTTREVITKYFDWSTF